MRETPSHARILVADDEDSIRFVLREALETAGHTVDEVETGQAALDRLASGTYDLAFLDIRMPGIGGDGGLWIDLFQSHPHPLPREGAVWPESLQGIGAQSCSFFVPKIASDKRQTMVEDGARRIRQDDRG